MILRSITLRQFRNHSQLQLAVDPGVNLFLGQNGAGKTNLIEALAILATGVSPRGAETESLIQWNTDGFFIHGVFDFESENKTPLSLEMKYRRGASRVVRQNGDTALRLRDLLGKVPLVSFVPEDLSMVKGEPDLRRHAINMILMQVNPLYSDSLRKYGDVLKSRNAALKQVAEGRCGVDALGPWDEALVQHGIEICKTRSAFLSEFSQRVSAVHERVSGGKENIRLVYEPSFPGPWNEATAERWKMHLMNSRSHEITVGMTLSGPQRDNFSFMLNDRPARTFASEGQKRTCAVSFKLAEIPYMEETLGQKPICILDDVLSELDAERAEHLLDELSKTGQCFVTLTGLEAWPREKELPAAIYRVDDTGVNPETEMARLAQALHTHQMPAPV